MKFQESNALTIPKYEGPFIYFLIKNKEVVYVEQTRHGLERPLSHRDKTFDEIKIIFCADSELDLLEDYFIRKYRAIYNKQNNTVVRRSLNQVRNHINSNTTQPKITIPKLKKILNKLNILFEKDCYHDGYTISYDDYIRLMEYMKNGEKINV